MLNRITWNREGIEWEGDQRHAEILVRELGLIGDSRGATTPAGKKTGQDLGTIRAVGQDELRTGELGQHPLEPSSASRYRGMVARVNYLAQDRSDIANTVKDLSKDMCNPTEMSMIRVKRLGRYLKNQPRFVLQFKYQEG